MMMDDDETEMPAHARANIADGSVMQINQLISTFKSSVATQMKLTIRFIWTKHRLRTRMRILLHDVDQILEFDVFCRVHLTCYCIRLIFVLETNHSSNLKKM